MQVDDSTINKEMKLHEVHQYFISILNCIPNWVYWIDKDCGLQGCNRRFSQFLGLKNRSDFSGTIYSKLAQVTQWSPSVMQAFSLDDMAVVFSGQATHDRELPPILFQDGTMHHFVCNREPLLDQTGRLLGAVVILSEIPEPKPKRLQSSISPLNQDANHRKFKALIVEDNLVAKQVEESLLRDLAFEVDCADTGQQATELFQPGVYDLVLMDIGLEDTSGYVLSKQFRELEKGTQFHVPIIALTSFEADLVKYDCDYYFMDGVITKPLRAEQANQILQHFILNKNISVDGLKRV